MISRADGGHLRSRRRRDLNRRRLQAMALIVASYMRDWRYRKKKGIRAILIVQVELIRFRGHPVVKQL